MRNKYYQVLAEIIEKGKTQKNKKGGITYLINKELTLSPGEMMNIFEEHPIAKKKLKDELALFMQGETAVDAYRHIGVQWWDYCWPTMINTYPTYFKKLPGLIDKINAEKRNSKNYMLFLGETDVETNQLPCISTMQFQIEDGKLVLTAYQRSSDANLGLPSDIYQL